MSSTNVCNTKSIILSGVAAGMLLSALIPFAASAQALPDQATAGQNRGAEAAERGGAPTLDTLRTQIETLTARVETLRAQARNAGVAQSDRGNAPSLENRMPTLPEQASDRAKQVVQCLQLSRPVGLGSRGIDVQQIQEFLMEKGFFNFTTATGYFGSITQEAIEAFQASQGIVSSGTPATTGFGFVGPRTREALAQVSCLNQGQTEAVEADGVEVLEEEGDASEDEDEKEVEDEEIDEAGDDENEEDGDDENEEEEV